MSDVPEPAAAASGLRRAEHARDGYDADIAVCRKVAVEDGALHYVSHITSGIFDFAFDRPGSRLRSVGAPETFDRAGRQLSLTVAQLDETCRPLESGILTRVVVQGNSGALFQFLKRARQTFFGLTLNGSRQDIDQADSQMARLSESAIRTIEARPRALAGFPSREAPGKILSVYKASPPVPIAISPHISKSYYPMPDAISQKCRAALSSGQLHFVGIYRGSRPAWCADVFDDPALTLFFQRVTPEVRRVGYTRLVGQVQLQSRRFEQLLDVVRSDRLTRLVLEVACGATFVLPLTEDDYLVGATLDQAGVSSADRQIQGLYERIRGAWRTHLWRIR